MNNPTTRKETNLLRELAACAFADHQRSAHLCEMLLGDRTIAETPDLCFAAAMARLAAIQSGATSLGWGTMRMVTNGEPRSVAVPRGPERVFSPMP
jgi:hypothetical protein